MKRLDFFKEMGDSLLQTVKTVYDPFLQEDLEKIEAATDRALGILWIPLMKEDELTTNLELKFIAGKPVIVALKETNIQAWTGICPVCSYIITVSTLYSTGKCLNCQKEFNFKTNSGELLLESLPLKIQEQMVHIGIHRKRKQGDHHA